MQTINIHQAKTNLSKLIERTLNGEDIIIAKAGKPVAKLMAYKEKVKPRKPGLWKGKVWVSPDFDEESEEINKLFYGEKYLSFGYARFEPFRIATLSQRPIR